MPKLLYKLGRTCATHPWRTLGAWLVVVIVVISANNAVGGELSDDFATPGLDSYDAFLLLQEGWADNSGIAAQIVVESPAGTTLDDPTQAAAVSQLQASLASWPFASDVQGLQVGPNPSSSGGQIGLLQVSVRDSATVGDEEVDEYIEIVASLDDLVEGFNETDGDVLRAVPGGDLYDWGEEPETGPGEMIGIGVAIIVLLVAFGSLIAMSLPLVVALFGLAFGVAGVIGLVALPFTVPTFVVIMATMIGLGVGIDYALFVLTRFREGLGDGLTKHDAAGRAVATAGLSVIFAGGTVVVAILGMGLIRMPFLTGAGVSVSVIVGIMVLASITVLPALLGLAGDRVNSRKRRRELQWRLTEIESSDAKVTVSPRWRAWGGHVSKFAWLYATAATALLIFLTLPLLWMQLGFPDHGNDPAESSTRQTYDLLTEGFGPGFSGPLLVVVDRSQASEAEVTQLAATIGADTRVARVLPPVTSSNGVASQIIAYPTTSPQDAETIEIVKHLRSDVFPAVLDDPTAAHIGGSTAATSDLADRLGERLPWFIGAVILLSIVLLTLLFRSVVVPIKAAILNLLSIGAAYGVLVAVFQWGWGKDLIGLAEPIPIISFLPMFMFAVLFGLSMDYEVFLLSRVKEEYVLSGDNSASVTAGLATTARVITSAALIMISVFVGFVINDDPIIKMMGLGLATAIFVDASIVRMILVPATMKLLGDTNWWFPRQLEWLPRADIEGEARLPAREYVQLNGLADQPRSLVVGGGDDEDEDEPVMDGVVSEGDPEPVAHASDHEHQPNPQLR